MINCLNECGPEQNNNKGYENLTEAWNECKKNTECLYVMYANGTNKYYLRTEKDKENQSDDENENQDHSWIQFQCASN